MPYARLSITVDHHVELDLLIFEDVAPLSLRHVDWPLLARVVDAAVRAPIEVQYLVLANWSERTAVCT